ncbi:hypothetical protein AB0G67_35610 [Streptomyces sp. NPDC021056]|uniref:hypothetical protein n=1 Tax=Streptomyces sp. NPDC021056 TaxID=3155012 RepID=UPI0033D89C03
MWHEEIEGALALMTALTETVQQAKDYRSEVAFPPVLFGFAPAPRAVRHRQRGKRPSTRAPAASTA